MIKVSDSTSIFEIVFAINAVFVVIASRYRENIERIYEHIKAGMKQQNMNTDSVRSIHLRTAAYEVFPNFKCLNVFIFRTCTLMSISGTTLSLGILIWNSFEPIKISSPFYIFILVSFCFISPALYFLFSSLSNYLIDRICSKHPRELDLTTILLLADTEQLLEESSKMQYRFIIREISRKYRATKVFFLETINPIFQVSKRRRNYESAKELLKKRREELGSNRSE